MSFGPELPPEEKARRLAIVNRAGMIVFASLAAIILFGALIAPMLL